MSLTEKLTGTNLKEAGYWSVIGVAGGFCLVTMVFVPLLALIAGGYLAVTEQYLLATGLAATGMGAGAWLYRRRTCGCDAGDVTQS